MHTGWFHTVLLGSWNGLDRAQLGVGKIGWKLEWISTKEKVGIGMENNCREIWDWKNW